MEPIDSYLTTPTELIEWCNRHDSRQFVAIDTEFERRRTFYPIPCLIQVATQDSICCIDTVAITNLDPLINFFNSTKRTLIFHAARQDIELLMPLGLKPHAVIFDTQLAASFCGLGDQLGYADLVFNLLKFEIDKSNQRANWLKRPLTGSQLNYAIEDVKHLYKLHDILKTQLVSLGRLDWFSEECLLVSSFWFNDSPHEAWKKLKNINSLPQILAKRACEVAVWREFLARELDKPRNWVLSDRGIKDLVVTDFESRAELEMALKSSFYIRGKSVGQLYKILKGNSIYKHIAYSRPGKPDAQQKQALENAMQSIQLIAKQHQIEPHVIATKRELKSLLIDRATNRLVASWRRKILAEVYQKLDLDLTYSERKIED
ncbi:MAG: hypothetical protein CBC29_01190 [Methylococcaceae bacterium TMED69]|nr:MAG: hypothetical protein CBC29_01190 [Methylococcaceae bacterium TMED69]